MIIKELFVKLGMDVDSASFAEGMVAGEGVIKIFEKLGEVVSEVAHKFIELFPEVAKEAEVNQRLAMSLGLTQNAFESLQHAAGSVGVQTEALSRGLGFLERSAFEASQGGEEAQKMFRLLGTSIYGANGKLKNADQLISDAAGKFSEIKDPIERSGLAMKIFGRGGREILPFLSLGKERLTALRHEFELWDNDLAEQANHSGPMWLHNMARTNSIFEQIKKTIAGPVLAALEKLSDEFLQFLNDNREDILAFAKAIGTTLGDAFIWLSKTIKGTIEIFQGLRKWFKEHEKLTGVLVALLGSALVGALIAATAAAIPLVAALVTGAAAALAGWIAAAAPFIALGALILGLAFIFDDFMTMLAGGKSAIAAWFESLVKYNPEDFWLVQAFKAALSMLTDLQGSLELFKQSLKTVLTLASVLPGQGYLGTIAGAIDVDKSRFPTYFQGGAASPGAAASQSSAVSQYMQAPAPFAPNIAVTVHTQPGADGQAIGSTAAQMIHEILTTQYREALNASK